MGRWLWIVVAVGCTAAPLPQGEPEPSTPTGDTTPPDPTDSPTTPVDTAPPVDTATTPTETLDCSQLPSLPVTFHTLTGYSDAEDFDFDGDGYAGAAYNGNLLAKDQAGDVKVIASNIGNVTAGTRILATGDWVVADVNNGSLDRVDVASGGQTTILGGLSYPNGVEVDRDHYVYVAEQDAGRIQVVNAYDPDDRATIASGLVNPNGVILSPDGTTLFVGSFGGGMIYAIDRIGSTPTGEWDEERILMDNPGWDGGFDGINVDACGNVYFTEYLVGQVWVIAADGSRIEMAADLPSTWIPNLRWGHDIGGWASDVLYVSDRDQGRIFGLELGIPGKKHVMVP